MKWVKRLIHKESDIFAVAASEGSKAQRVESTAPAIVAISSGKGGVGKSLLTSTLGLLFAKVGMKVLLIDADLGASNLHTFLVEDGGTKSLTCFLNREVANIKNIIVKTAVPGLDLISGANDDRDVAILDSASIGRLRGGLYGVEYDYVILDTGPGTSSNMLDLFLTADIGILVTTPEPTSIENTYSFIKYLFLHRLKKILRANGNSSLALLIHRALGKQESDRARTLADLLDRLKGVNTAQGNALKAVMSSVPLSIVVNQVKKKDNPDIGLLMKRACSDYFGIEVGCLGTIRYEDCVADAMRARMPLSMYAPASMTVRSIRGVADKLMYLKKKEFGDTTHQIPYAECL